MVDAPEDVGRVEVAGERNDAPPDRRGHEAEQRARGVAPLEVPGAAHTRASRAAGMLVGVTVLQVPDIDAPATDSFAAVSLMGDLESMMGEFILPAADVLSATRRAQAAAAEQALEESVEAVE